MAICPFADFINFHANQPNKKKIWEKDQVILHTIGAFRKAGKVYGGTTDSALSAWKGNGLDSTFIVKADGKIIQVVPSDRQASANPSSNGRAISVETEDYWGDVVKENIGWKEEQLDALLRLIRWCITAHPCIKLQRCPDPYSPGIGYHRMFGAPSPWTLYSKACPGPARILQYENYLMPTLLGETVKPESEWKTPKEVQFAPVHRKTKAKC